MRHTRGYNARRYWSAIIMKQISSGEALRELKAWNKDSRVTCAFSVSSARAVFRLERVKLDIRESIIFLESETGNGMLDLAGCSFSMTEPGDLPLELKRGFPPLADTGIRVTFENGDICFFFPKR